MVSYSLLQSVEIFPLGIVAGHFIFSQRDDKGLSHSDEVVHVTLLGTDFFVGVYPILHVHEQVSLWDLRQEGSKITCGPFGHRAPSGEKEKYTINKSLSVENQSYWQSYHILINCITNTHVRKPEVAILEVLT